LNNLLESKQVTLLSECSLCLFVTDTAGVAFPILISPKIPASQQVKV